MLGIKINNEYLDLPADIGVEMVRNNPYLTDDIQGEYSLGLTLRYTDRNYRILTYAGNFYRKNEKLLFDAEIYDNGAFRYGGVMVINQHSSNLNRISETIWTGFFTIGSSSFLQQIQDVRLQDLDLGGERSFPWTTDNPGDGSAGFWQHVHAARVPNSFPYTFYPIYNPGWGWKVEYPITWENRLDSNNNFRAFDNDHFEEHLYDTNVISLVPAIYYSYILTRAFAQFGWKLSGDILLDPGFIKLTMPSFRSIFWAYFFLHPLGNYYIDTLPLISFNLADHVPQNFTIGSFITNLKSRFGWYFEFDSNVKTAYLKAHKNLINLTPKDWTEFASAPYTAEYQTGSKKFSLINNIDSNDLYPVVLNIDEATLFGSVYEQANLPDPAIPPEGSIMYAFLENTYFITQSNPSTNTFSWVLYSHNIGNYEPAGADTPIESEISTMAVTVQAHRDYIRGLFPTCNQAGNYNNSIVGPVISPKDWGMRALFYHGMVMDINNDGTLTDAKLYPYASAHSRSINNNFLGAWSIPYRHEYQAVNDGTYDYWWKDWLILLSIQDTRTFTLLLPITELKKFSFNDTIVINNVFFIVVSFKEVLPYKDVSEFKMKRIY